MMDNYEEYKEKYLEIYTKALDAGDFDAALAAVHEMSKFETRLIVCKICGNKDFWEKA